MGETIKGFPADAAPLFGADAPRRRSTLLDFCRVKPEAVNYTVFLVEDDTEQRGHMLQTLQRSPFIHNVHWFNDGDAMLRHFVQEGYCTGRVLHQIPTIVLLNTSLPGTSGMDILRRLKENPATSGVPVVLLCEEYSDGLASDAQRLRAAALLVKPLSLARVHEVLQNGSSWQGEKF